MPKYAVRRLRFSLSLWQSDINFLCRVRHASAPSELRPHYEYMTAINYLFVCSISFSPAKSSLFGGIRPLELLRVDSLFKLLIGKWIIVMCITLHRRTKDRPHISLSLKFPFHPLSSPLVIIFRKQWRRLTFDVSKKIYSSQIQDDSMLETPCRRHINNGIVN